MPVNFAHQNHARKYGCRECHPALFQMKSAATKIIMEDMYKGGTCGKCHNGKTAFSSKDCAKCHNMTAIKKDFTYPSKDMSPAVFSHQVHTAMFECGNCHTSLFKYKKGGSGMKMDDLYQNRFCGKCHNGEAAFGSSECQNCHK
jgi:c(7)-type cytochrome triheme protein